MGKIKIAQIGLGHDHALWTLQSIIDNKEKFELVGLAESNNQNMRKLNILNRDKKVKIITVEELLNMSDLQAVAVETEEKELAKYSIMFAEKGIAVHVDKPGSYNLSDFETLIETVKKNNSVFQIAYMYRYNPLIKDCIKKVKEGKLGEIFSIEAQMSICHPYKKREWLGNFKGGMMYFLGCHLIDLILQIQGEPEEIIPYNCNTQIENLKNAEDFGFAVLKYKNGVSTVKTCAVEINGYNRRQLVVCGSKGTYEIKPLEINEDTPSWLHSEAKITYENESIWKDKGEKIVSASFNRYDEMMNEFADIILGEADNPYTPEYELRLFKTILMCCGRN